MSKELPRDSNGEKSANTAVEPEEDKSYQDQAKEWFDESIKQFEALESRFNALSTTGGAATQQAQLEDIELALSKLLKSLEGLKYNTKRRVPEEVEYPTLNQIEELRKQINKLLASIHEKKRS
jgi:hypothetical protein